MNGFHTSIIWARLDEPPVVALKGLVQVLLLLLGVLVVDTKQRHQRDLAVELGHHHLDVLRGHSLRMRRMLSVFFFSHESKC